MTFFDDFVGNDTNKSSSTLGIINFMDDDISDVIDDIDLDNDKNNSEVETDDNTGDLSAEFDLF